MLTRMKTLLPDELRRGLHTARYAVQIMSRLYGKTSRECPACGYHGRFFAAGHPPRYDAECPGCRSLERHRLMALALNQLHLIKETDRVVHFAPEIVVQRLIKHIGAEYQSADIVAGRGDLQLNIEEIDLPDNDVTVFVASHVLEHVDDRRALSELYRVLKPGGCLIAAVPIIHGWDVTYENAAIQSPEDRDVHFGQFDHLRYYGNDFRRRIEEAGFTLNEFVCSGDESVRYGLAYGDRIFIGTKEI